MSALVDSGYSRKKQARIELWKNRVFVIYENVFSNPQREVLFIQSIYILSNSYSCSMLRFNFDETEKGLSFEIARISHSRFSILDWFLHKRLDMVISVFMHKAKAVLENSGYEVTVDIVTHCSESYIKPVYHY